MSTIQAEKLRVQQIKFIADLLRQGKFSEAVSVTGPASFPHSVWVLGDGRQILLGRSSYVPLWQCREGIVKAANNEWYEQIVKQDYFFDDWPALHKQYNGMRRLRSVLEDWGLIRRQRKQLVSRRYER